MRKRSGTVALTVAERLPRVKRFERAKIGREPLGFDSEHVPVFDPAPLTGDQRRGDACVLCAKRWPRPVAKIGRIPTGDTVRACSECAPQIALQVHGEAVRQVLRQAVDRVEAVAPQLLPALTAAAPFRERPGRFLEDAAVAVARHIAETEDLGGQLAHRADGTDGADGGAPLPAPILRWEDAQVWLAAWALVDPPAAVIREVLVHLLETPGALARALLAQALARAAEAPEVEALPADAQGGR